MDPLSIAAGAAGFVALTIQLSDKVSRFVKAWKNAGEDATAFNDLVWQLTKTFDVLQTSIKRCQLSPDVVDLVQTHLNACRTSLRELISELAEVGLHLNPKGKPKQQSKSARYGLKVGKIKRLEEICEALKARLGFALSVLTVEAHAEILNTVTKIDADVQKVFTDVNGLKEKTANGFDQVSAGIDVLKIGVNDVRGEVDTGNNLISSGIKQVLDGVGQVSTNIDSVDRHVVDKIGNLRTSLHNLESQTTRGFDQIAADVNGIYPHITRHALEITEVMHNLHSQVAPVLTHIEESQKRLEARQSEVDNHAFYKWLSPLTQDFKSKHREVYDTETRQEGIGTWLLGTSEFQKWRTGSPTTLWCLGNQGAGKTMLTSFIIESLKHLKFQHEAMAFLYCDYRQAEKQTPSYVLGSVVHQLALQQEISVDRLAGHVQWNTQRDDQPSLEEIGKLLRLVVKGLSRTYLIVDAIDECSTETRDTLLRELQKVEPKFHLLVTTRQRDRHYDSKSHFALNINAREEDIAKYIEARLKNSIGFELNLTHDQALQEEIVKRIVQTAGGMFLLAKLHFDLLQDALCPRDIRDVLNSLPPGLTNTYDAMVDRIVGQGDSKAEIAFRTIAWIGLARRPLKVEEIQHALAVCPGDTCFDKDGIKSIDLIIQCCGGFVGPQQDDTLGFVHYTTQEYLLTRSKYGHGYIARICLTYLSFDDFSQGICPNFKILMSRLNYHALLDYACRNWGHHLRSSEDIDLQVLGLRFCREKQKALGCIQVIREKESQYGGMFQGKLGRPLETYNLETTPFTDRFYGPWLAAHFGLYEISTLLLRDPEFDMKQSFDDKDSWWNWKDYPLCKAVGGGWPDLVTLFLDYGAHLSSVNSDRLRWLYESYMKTPQRECMASCIFEFARSRHIQEAGTILHFALEIGNIEAAFVLLKREIDVNTKDLLRGRTSLHWASLGGHYDVARLILDRGANIAAKDHRGETPLHLASSAGHESTTQMLLDYGANVDATDTQHQTPLHRASHGGHSKIIQTMLENGADIQSRNDYGSSPLHHAVKGHHVLGARYSISELQALSDHSAADETLDDYEQVLLHCTAGRGHLVAMQTLLNHGADIKAKDDHGRTPEQLGIDLQDEVPSIFLKRYHASLAKDPESDERRVAKDIQHSHAPGVTQTNQSNKICATRDDQYTPDLEVRKTSRRNDTWSQSLDLRPPSNIERSMNHNSREEARDHTWEWPEEDNANGVCTQ